MSRNLIQFNKIDQYSSDSVEEIDMRDEKKKHTPNARFELEYYCNTTSRTLSDANKTSKSNKDSTANIQNLIVNKLETSKRESLNKLHLTEEESNRGKTSPEIIPYFLEPRSDSEEYSWRYFRSSQVARVRR